MDAGLGGSVGECGAVRQGVDDPELLLSELVHNVDFRLHDSLRVGKTGGGRRVRIGAKTLGQNGQ
jgi:hypothetical protein